MLLAIDIGNTDITLGVFEREELRATWHMATGIHRMADEYAATLLNLLRHQNLATSDIKEVVLCSVVPPLITTFEELSQKYFQIAPLVVGAGVKTGVRIRMDNPKEVGADRIVNAAAAHHLYGGPVIITDLGTATTFDTVSREGDYLGGAIAPGIKTAAEAMFTRAAMLPRVELVRPKQTIGTNTISAIQSGLIFGYVGLIEGIVTRLRKELGGKALVVVTGGDAELVAQETKVIDKINPDLTLIGLQLIYLMNQTQPEK
ncbi:MAG: type III pantothenate kinase [Dehalococcoidales bacterium]|jgi:type III pantothenate kinase|nr:type III pantothenate kinase [Dehalococcoidales bacterium]MDP7286064.1 type III pantothenate kinase [Dehalococcoidales bacterium]MDP7415412.1 type III pantothenate kinase [Dehalococcoidales bacterium]